MQAVILAAGQSSRMYPFNNGSHKSMIKIMGKPIIYYTIEALKNSGITDLIIVVNAENKIGEYFGNGKKFGVSIKYSTQKDPQGAGDALILAGKHITGDFFLLNASHVDVDTFIGDLQKGKKEGGKAVLLAKNKPGGVLQGILKFKGDKVEEIIEKPKNVQPPYLYVVGIYLLPYDFLKILQNTPPEHYQLEKAISLYAKNNSVLFQKTLKETVSLKYPWDILGVKNYLLKNIKENISPAAKIAKSAEIIGKVFLEDGVSIMENVVIKGPCYIGQNAYVGNNAVLRGGIDIGKNAVVGANMEIKNSTLMQNSTTHSGYIGDSVIGENCKIAAGFFTANVRLDRANIKTQVKEEKIDTGLGMLGVMLGNDSNLGIKVTTMPGIIIGRNVIVGASTTVMNNIADNTKYYTRFQEIVSKKNTHKPIVLFDIDYTLFDTASFKESKLLSHKIYQEVAEVLSNLSKIATLGIFSKGETEFQKTKLKKTGMIKFFKENNIHIFADKDVNLINVLKKYASTKLFLVDDKLEILYSAKKHMSGIVTIWVKRGPFAENQKEIFGFKPDAQVENLSEVVRIVKSNL